MNYNLFPSPEFKASWKTDTRSKDLKKQTNKQNPLLWTKHGVEDKISRCSQRALLRFLTDQLGRLTQAAPGCTAGHPCRAVHLLRFREQTRKQPQRWFDRGWAIQSHFPLPNSFSKQYTSLPQRRENVLGAWGVALYVPSFPSQGKVMSGEHVVLRTIVCS